ncbi:MAG TPA: RNA polymerase sporulation sigma factor SigK [Firmicutes bacterium]|nr:RNA polymerase sporulation sigma factor SigK [Bacillota bacterium]
MLVILSALSQIFAQLSYFILHVTSQGSFPRPLTAKEERLLLQRYKEEGDMEARSKLIEHNLRLVAHIIKKYYSSQRDQDDLISIGTIGLIKAVTTYKQDKGIRLATYAAKCIENEILMHFRNMKKCSQDVFISDPIDTDNDGNRLTLSDIIAEDDCIADNIDIKMKSEKLKEYIKDSLDDREKTVIKLRYGLGGQDELTQREVAKRLNISRSYVSRIEKKALQKLNNRFMQK